MKQCFECETTEDLQEHHVVPRSRGGTKTVTLCYQCHMKAHGRSGKGQDHKKLTKQGMKRALKKRREMDPDFKWGGPITNEIRAKAIQTRIDKADTYAREHGALLTSLYNQTGSYIGTSRELNKMGIKTQNGKKWYASSVRNLLKRHATLEKK